MLEEQLIAARWALYLDLGLLFGLPFFALYNGRGDDAGSKLPLRAPVAILALVGLLLSVWAFLVMTAGMMGEGLSSLDREALRMVIMETNVGWAFVARLLALLVVAALAMGWGTRGKVALAGTTLFSGIAVSSLAWSGHGAATDGALGIAHLANDIVHLLAASAWIGALAAFLSSMSASRRRSAEALEAAHRTLDGFALSGSVIVALIVISGIVNSALLVGADNLLTLGTTSYGRLLIIKLALFFCMVALAASNRFRLTPAIRAGMVVGDTAGPVARLRGSLWLEFGAGVAILGLVGWLGTLAPPAST